MLYRHSKRFLDIVAGVSGLIILSPIFIIISIILKLTGEGEVFYFQKRIGLNNKYFYIWKFATMMKNSSKMGTGAITLQNDPRVLPVGKFLRKTKINELPQIINIVLGDMSIVGPRPLVDQTFNAYSPEVQSIIYKKKPGITGLGSIAFRDEEKFISAYKDRAQAYYQEVIAPYKGELELWYHKNASFWVDIKIIIITAWVVLSPNSNILFSWFPDLPKRVF